MVFGGDGFDDGGMSDIPLVELCEIGNKHYLEVRKSIGLGGFPQ